MKTGHGKRFKCITLVMYYFSKALISVYLHIYTALHQKDYNQTLIFCSSCLCDPFWSKADPGIALGKISGFNWAVISHCQYLVKLNSIGSRHWNQSLKAYKKRSVIKPTSRKLCESKQKIKRRREAANAWEWPGLFQDGNVSYQYFVQCTADSWKHPWADDFGLPNTRWNKHDPESDAKGETLSRLSQMPQRSIQEWTKISRIPPPQPFQEVKIAGVLAPHHPWTLLVVQHLPLSLSCSGVWSSGNQRVGVWYIFFQTLWQGLHFVNTARHIW